MSKRISLREELYRDLKKEWGKFLDVLRAKENSMAEVVDENLTEIVSYLEMAKELIDEHIGEIEQGEEAVTLADSPDEYADPDVLREEIKHILDQANDFTKSWTDDFEGKSDCIYEAIQAFTSKYDWSSSVTGPFSYAQSELFGSKASYQNYDSSSEDVKKFEELFEKSFGAIGPKPWHVVMQVIDETNQEILEYAQDSPFQFINEDLAYWPQERSEYRPMEMVERYSNDRRWMTRIEEHNPHLAYLADELHRMNMWNMILQHSSDTTGAIYSFFAWCAYWIPNFQDVLPLFSLEKVPLKIEADLPASDEYVLVRFPTEWLGGDWYSMSFYLHKDEIRPDWQSCAGPFSLYFLMQLKEPLSQMPNGNELFLSLFKGFEHILKEEDNFFYYPLYPSQNTDVEPSEFEPRFPFPLDEDDIPTLSLLEVDAKVIASRWAHAVALLTRWQGNLKRFSKESEVPNVFMFEGNRHVEWIDIQDDCKKLGMTSQFVDLVKSNLLQELKATGPFFKEAIGQIRKSWENDVTNKNIIQLLDKSLRSADQKQWKDMEVYLAMAIADFHFLHEDIETFIDIANDMFFDPKRYKVVSLDDWLLDYNLPPVDNYSVILNLTKDTLIPSTDEFDSTRFAMRMAIYVQRKINERERDVALENWASGSDEDLIR